MGRRRLVQAVGVGLAALALFPGAVTGRTLPAERPLETWIPNGPVSAVVIAGDRVVVGGAFSRVGPPTGGTVLLDPVTGTLLSGLPAIGGGTVRAVADDGLGGLYLGGDFTTVGGLPRVGLAHVLADGSVDPTFDARPGSSDPHGAPYPNVLLVNAIARTPNGLLVGGGFGAIRGAPRASLAMLDPATGDALPWDAQLAIDGSAPTVASLTVLDGIVYVAGQFTQAGGEARTGLAALDLSTARATAWDPRAPTWATGLGPLLVADGVVYYSAGTGLVNDGARQGPVALDPTTGLHTPWGPDVPPDSVILAVGPGRAFVAAPVPTAQAPGRPARARTELIALDTAPGGGILWRVRVAGRVSSATLVGDAVAIGGWFTAVAGQPRRLVALLDAATGALRPWDAALGGPAEDALFGAAISTLVAPTTRGLLVSGAFSTVGGEPRAGLAAFDRTTGALLPWRPRLDGPVDELADLGGTVYAVGRFRHVDGTRRDGAAAFDAAGALTRWTPRGLPDDPTTVTATRDRVLLGRARRFGERPASPGYLLAVDPVTGARQRRWQAPQPEGRGVARIVAGHGAIFAVGGLRPDASGIWEIEPATGRLRRELVRERGPFTVQDAAVAGDFLYVATTLPGEAIDLRTGRRTAWAAEIEIPPGEGPPDVFSSLAVLGGTVLGTSYNAVVFPFDALTGRAVRWPPGRPAPATSVRASHGYLVTITSAPSAFPGGPGFAVYPPARPSP